MSEGGAGAGYGFGLGGIAAAATKLFGKKPESAYQEAQRTAQFSLDRLTSGSETAMFPGAARLARLHVPGYAQAESEWKESLATRLRRVVLGEETFGRDLAASLAWGMPVYIPQARRESPPPSVPSSPTPWLRTFGPLPPAPAPPQYPQTIPPFPPVPQSPPPTPYPGGMPPPTAAGTAIPPPGPQGWTWQQRLQFYPQILLRLALEYGIPLWQLVEYFRAAFGRRPRSPNVGGMNVAYYLGPQPTSTWESIGAGLGSLATGVGNVINAIRGGSSMAMPGGAPTYAYAGINPGSLIGQIPSWVRQIAPYAVGIGGAAALEAATGYLPSGGNGCSALSSPWSAGGAGPRARTFMVPNPVTGNPTWFRPAGRPLLWSGDLSAARRVRRVASKARRRAGGR